MFIVFVIIQFLIKMYTVMQYTLIIIHVYVHRILIYFYLLQRMNYGQNLVEEEFVPSVTATCKTGYMTIKVTTNQPFVG